MSPIVSHEMAQSAQFRALVMCLAHSFQIYLKCQWYGWPPLKCAVKQKFLLASATGAGATACRAAVVCTLSIKNLCQGAFYFITMYLILY